MIVLAGKGLVEMPLTNFNSFAIARDRLKNDQLWLVPPSLQCCF